MSQYAEQAKEIVVEHIKTLATEIKSGVRYGWPPATIRDLEERMWAAVRALAALEAATREEE